MACLIPTIKALTSFSVLILIGTCNLVGWAQAGIQDLKKSLEQVEYYDETRKGDLYLSIASTLTNIHQYAESTRYCKLAYDCFEHTKRPDGTANVLLVMYDNAYFSQDDSTNTSYLDQALGIARESRDSSLLSNVCFSIGKAWYRSGNQEKAISSYKMAKAYANPLDIGKQMTICIYQHLSYTICDSVDQACRLSAYILSTTRANNMEDYFSNAYLGRAFCLAKTGFEDSTKYYLDLSHEWRMKTPKAKASPGYFEQMYKVSMMISDYDRALKYLEIKAEQENQINRKNNAAVLADSRAEFDYRLQKARIGELRAQNSIAEEKVKRRKTTILGIGAILLISVVSLLNMRTQYKSLGHSYETLVKKHIEVDKLNQQLINGNGRKSNKRAGVYIKDEDKILAMLKKLLQEDKIYKISDLSLSNLAEELGTNTSYLSTIINSHYQVNLKTLVNTCRIDEARKILVSKEGENFSIEGIAREVGFQSRSVFYQTFKQITGLTPSAYVKIYKSACPDS